MSSQGVINASTDFNSLVNPGYYQIQTASAPNSPPTQLNGTLLVDGGPGANGFVTQQFTAFNSPYATFLRTLNFQTSTTSSWQAVAYASTASNSANYVAVYSGNNSPALQPATAVTALAQDFGATSDQRLKTVINNIADPLDKINKINGVNFVWNQAGREFGMTDNAVQVGVLAQEVQKILPSAVYQKDDTLFVSYDKIVPLLIEAVKELSQEIKKLKGDNS